MSFFTRGAPENWGDQVLCLRSKGGIKRFFQIKKTGSLISVKEIKYFVKHSWNSLLLILQKRWFCPLLELFKTRLRAAIWGESGFHTTKEHDRQPLQTFARSKKTYSKWTFGKFRVDSNPGPQDHQSNTQPLGCDRSCQTDGKSLVFMLWLIDVYCS